MPGYFIKHNGEWRKAKSVHYKHNGEWRKAKSLRYKNNGEWSRNVIQDMELTYSVGNTEFIRDASYAQINVYPSEIIGQIGMAFNQAVNLTSINSIRFVYDKHQYGNVTGVATFSIYTQPGGNRDQYTLKADVNSFGNELSTGLSVSSYTGNYYIRVHLLMNPTNEVGAFSLVNLRKIYVTENNIERILWDAEV